MSARGAHPNRLLWAAITVSLALHGMVAVCLDGLDIGAKTERFEVELVLPPPRHPTREIPRPAALPVPRRPLAQQPTEAQPATPLAPSPPHPPAPALAVPAPARTEVPSVAPEAFSVPDGPSGPWPSRSGPSSEDPLKAYLGQIRQRIEANKVYPAPSRKSGEEGAAVVRFALARDGQLLAVDIATSTGYPRLDQAAREAIRRSAPFPRLPGEDTSSLAFYVSIVFVLSAERPL